MTAHPLPSMHLSRADRDRQLSPSLSAKDAAGVLARHSARTSALWSDPDFDCTRDLSYGAAPRQLLDVVRPLGPGPFPCLIFLHGGFWQEGDKGGSGFAARRLGHAGWASALVGYSLAPDARLSEIVTEVGQAIDYLADNAGELRLDPKRFILAGHSAGGHLAAALICGKAGQRTAETIAGAVLISGVYDLEPIAMSYVNEAVGLDADDVRALSVLDENPISDIPIHLLIGEDEPAAFQEQTDALAAAWSNSISALSLHREPGCDHFNILDELASLMEKTQ